MNLRRVFPAFSLLAFAVLLVQCAPKPRVPERPQPEMVLIPAGAYVVGADSGDYDERPAHPVVVEPYYIDKYEVTNAQFMEFVREAGYPPPNRWLHRLVGEGDQWRENAAWRQAADEPVTWITWHDADAYAKWRGCRLPSETEWEVAARGSLAVAWPWGNSTQPITGKPGANVAGVEDGFAEVAPVGSFEDGASVFGVMDMAGNVWEWCADWYLPSAYDLEGVDPRVGVQDSLFGQRSIRGGSWFDPLDAARTTRRRGFDPGFPSDLVGFRCVRDAE